jgi:hypothetical protein
MDERINNLHQSITDLSSDLQLAAAEYSYESMENEFPGLNDYYVAWWGKTDS